ncbi:hypothetical protein GN244_ATG15380 [Phytophthora infestans]|uniref:Uncharacterized protein n=1 Tax=Phytophthora infestans TaxID=4787 RepID=A0A833VXE6_PHYIN|nr:hypothetical protein GN244_ATG15380 [Phytophthora infestans]
MQAGLMTRGAHIESYWRLRCFADTSSDEENTPPNLLNRRWEPRGKTGIASETSASIKTRARSKTGKARETSTLSKTNRASARSVTSARNKTSEAAASPLLKTPRLTSMDRRRPTGHRLRVLQGQ